MLLRHVMSTQEVGSALIGTPLNHAADRLKISGQSDPDLQIFESHTHTQISCFYREIFILIIFLSPLSGGAESDCPTLLCCSDTIG